MIVKVEQRHIDAGQRADVCYCPVALALREMFAIPPVADRDEAFDQAGAGHNVIWVGDDQWRTPSLVNAFITAFDAKQPVAPITFDLVDRVGGES